jgi:hypothetical protein
VEIDGVKIPATSIVDGLCIFYLINLGQVPRKLEEQINYLSKHLEQLSDWIMILERNPTYHPTALTVSWKRDRQRAKKIAFGVSLIGILQVKVDMGIL